jgi:SAM-dependent methyltransferase
MSAAIHHERTSLDVTLRRLRCPACFGALGQGPDSLVCGDCEARYPISDGIPIVLPRDLDQQKLSQRAFFDEGTDDEWEIVRPFGAPALYRCLLEERFVRAIRGLESRLPGASALVVCGGSGMDAQFLARAGASVTTSDLSSGAARRACERARRFGFELVSVVADAERLPFRDRSFDLVYVHDGLHHLERPEAVLGEMARVASQIVVVTEPAEAAATRLAVRIGVALEREEAGNTVERLTLDRVSRTLSANGFRTVRSNRYAMFYRHEPGWLARALSTGPLLPVAVAALRTANAIAGPLGNKLVVQALREAP